LAAVLVVAPLSVAISSSAPAGAATQALSTHLLTCAMKKTTRPSNYLLSCGDANAGFVAMKWSTWTLTSATGHGILRQNDCKPNCVSGKWIRYTASVSLGKVVLTKKYGPLFSQAIFHWNVNGVPKSEVFGLAD
jgi:hypothetical protein